MAIQIPAALTAIAGAIGGILTVVARFAENPLIAWILTLVFLLADSGFGAITNSQGISGTLISWVFGALGVPIVVYAWQALIIIAILPIVSLAVQGSLNG